MKFLVALSLVLNGALAGLIAGHLLTQADPAPCRCRRSETPQDRGPFPTGWVVPDREPRPAGEAR